MTRLNLKLPPDARVSRQRLYFHSLVVKLNFGKAVPKRSSASLREHSNCLLSAQLETPISARERLHTLHLTG